MAGRGGYAAQEVDAELHNLAASFYGLCQVDLGQMNAPTGVGAQSLPMQAMVLWDLERLRKVANWRAEEDTEKRLVAKFARVILGLRELYDASSNLQLEQRMCTAPAAQMHVDYAEEVKGTAAPRPVVRVVEGSVLVKRQKRGTKANTTASSSSSNSDTKPCTVPVIPPENIVGKLGNFTFGSLLGDMQWGGSLRELSRGFGPWHAQGRCAWQAIRMPAELFGMLKVWLQTASVVWCLIIFGLTAGPPLFVLIFVFTLVADPEWAWELLGDLLSVPGDWLQSWYRRMRGRKAPSSAATIVVANQANGVGKFDFSQWHTQCVDSPDSPCPSADSSSSQSEQPIVLLPAQAAPSPGPAQLVGAAGMGALAWKGGTLGLAALISKMQAPP